MTTLPPEQVHNTQEDLTLILPTFSNAILKDATVVFIGVSRCQTLSKLLYHLVIISEFAAMAPFSN